MSDPRLSTAALSIGYKAKGQPDRVVASDLNLDLQPGEFVCLLGPNGAGKSTLIRALAGMESPLGGSIEISGTDIETLSPKQRARQISVVLTESLPVGMFSARSLVALGRHPHTSWTGNLTDLDQDRIEWALATVDATSLADRQVSELSDGERQKIMVARALAQEASIMLLDEPTAYLDLPRRVELMRTLRELTRKEGLSVLLSTHDLDLALRSADRLWLFSEDGKLVTGMPEELALEGTLQAAFASDKLDWDEEQGSFRLHREPSKFVYLEGKGAAYSWTRRALARIGYGVIANVEGSEIRIQISEGDEITVWNVDRGGSLESFESLATVVASLQGGSAVL